MNNQVVYFVGITSGVTPFEKVNNECHKGFTAAALVGNDSSIYFCLSHRQRHSFKPSAIKIDIEETILLLYICNFCQYWLLSHTI